MQKLQEVIKVIVCTRDTIYFFSILSIISTTILYKWYTLVFLSMCANYAASHLLTAKREMAVYMQGIELPYQDW